MGIWITGDIHGNPMRFHEDVFFEQQSMNSKDENYVIICGDAALLWDYRGENIAEEDALNWLNNKPFTTLFIDGNHENFDRLNSIKPEMWHGGLVHKLRDKVIHLMRGQIYTILGKTFFTFGGAKSHDTFDGILEADETEKIHQYYIKGKVFRINKVSWWEEEMPSQTEKDEGLKNLSLNGFKVDYIITHTPPSGLLACFNANYGSDELSDYLEDIRIKTKYKYWFCGHMHVNQKNTEHDICLYEQIVKLL